MNPVVKTIKPVIEKSRYVKINGNNLRQACLTINQNNIKYWMKKSPVGLSALSDQERLNFIFVFNSINFCYWGTPKWAIEYQGKQYDGAWAMIAAIKRALDNKIPVLNSKYLASLNRQGLSKILRGNVLIPLFDERLKILKENGDILERKYDGQFSRVVENANNDALELLALLVADFPSFDDHTFYNAQKILFYKRAQLAISDIYRTFKGQGFGKLKHIEQLTAFADYKIPQSLRKLGILEYSPELSSKIDNKIAIPKDSKEEIEIRANTIWAIELMKRELKTKISNITSMDIDSYLWLLGQKKSPHDKPYHLTRTIFY